MKKIVYILLLISSVCFAQEPEYDAVYLRDKLVLNGQVYTKDSLLISDTLIFYYTKVQTIDSIESKIQQFADTSTYISTTGTPSGNQIGVFSGSNTLTGTPGLQHNGTALILSGDITMNDDERIQWGSNRIQGNSTSGITINLNTGAGDWRFTNEVINGLYYIQTSNGVALMGETPSFTNPVFSFNGDYDTGWGRGGANILSGVAGGANAINIHPDSVNINNLNVTDSSDIYNAIAKWHRVDSINTTLASTWVSVKWDTNIVEESTYGIDILTDSTGFEFTTSGVFRVSGCAHASTGSPGTVEVGIRGTTDGTENRCLQANVNRTNAADDQFNIPFGGTIRVVPGTVFRIQYYVSSVNMDFEGADIFDSPIAFSVNFEKISR